MEKQITLNEEELKALSDKLSKFGNDLSEKEQQVLNLVLARASGGKEGTITEKEITSDVADQKQTIMKLSNAVFGKTGPTAETSRNSIHDEPPTWVFVIWPFKF